MIKKRNICLFTRIYYIYVFLMAIKVIALCFPTLETEQNRSLDIYYYYYSDNKFAYETDISHACR